MKNIPLKDLILIKEGQELLLKQTSEPKKMVQINLLLASININIERKTEDEF